MPRTAASLASRVCLLVEGARNLSARVGSGRNVLTPAKTMIWIFYAKIGSSAVHLAACPRHYREGSGRNDGVLRRTARCDARPVPAKTMIYRMDAIGHFHPDIASSAIHLSAREADGPTVPCGRDRRRRRGLEYCTQRASQRDGRHAAGGEDHGRWMQRSIAGVYARTVSRRSTDRRLWIAIHDCMKAGPRQRTRDLPRPFPPKQRLKPVCCPPDIAASWPHIERNG